ncbi:MAG: bifunctional folylpolyglutamate synthase/dihydrofolate synthase [archaeon]|nr:bifunctional folylpolyglutamate synthase/dihydrofolate synthase [archaeon]
MAMDYAQAKKWLYSLKLVMKGYDLKNMQKLVQESRLDLAKLRAIHVSGSNGKGSTCAFASQILQEAGHKTGFYSSPHLIEPTERIRVNGKNIPRKRFAELANYYKNLIAKNRLAASYFEATTAMAFKYFIEEKVDFLVCEVGLGGRLDATNVLDAQVAIITRISKEHTQTLGKTNAKIAREKSGIIKSGAIAITPHDNAGKFEIKKRCKEIGATLLETNWSIQQSDSHRQKFSITKPAKLAGLEIKMLGKHQCENASLAATAAMALAKKDHALAATSAITQRHIRAGLKKAFWKGRLEKIRNKPLVILDAAHNPNGWDVLFPSLRVFGNRDMIVVFGAMSDKEIEKVRPHLRKAKRVILTVSNSFRAEEPEKLRKRIGFGEIIVPEKKAIHDAIKGAGKNDLVLVTGSIYLVGNAYGKKY